MVLKRTKSKLLIAGFTVTYCALYAFVALRSNILGEIKYPSPSDDAILSLVYVFGSSILYFCLYRFLVSERIKKDFLLKIVKRFLIPCTIITGILTAPLLSQDIYWNLYHTKAFVFHSENPYNTTPEKLAYLNLDFDKLTKGWRDVEMTYGPVNMYLFAVGTIFNNINLNLLVLKIITAGLFVGVLYFLKKENVLDENKWVLFALNPLIHLNVFSELHNDFFILILVLASYFFYKKNLFFLSFVTLLFSILTKYIPIIILPGFLLHIYEKRDIKFVIVLLMTGLLISVLAYLPFTDINLSSEFNVTKSVLQVTKGLKYQNSLGGGEVLQTLGRAAPAVLLLIPVMGSTSIKILGVVLATSCAIYFFNKEKIEEGFSWPFIILLFFFSWFFSWYFLWGLPLAMRVLKSQTTVFLTFILLLTTIMSVGGAVALGVMLFLLGNWLATISKSVFSFGLSCANNDIPTEIS